MLYMKEISARNKRMWGKEDDAKMDPRVGELLNLIQAVLDERKAR